MLLIVLIVLVVIAGVLLALPDKNKGEGSPSSRPFNESGLGNGGTGAGGL